VLRPPRSTRTLFPSWDAIQKKLPNDGMVDLAVVLLQCSDKFQEGRGIRYKPLVWDQYHHDFSQIVFCNRISVWPHPYHVVVRLPVLIAPLAEQDEGLLVAGCQAWTN